MLMMTKPPIGKLAQALGIMQEQMPIKAESPPHPWHILLSEPQCEFKVAEWLLYRGLRPYVPALRKHTLMRFHRRRSITVPMFRGYVFLQDDPSRDDLWDEVHLARGARGGLHFGGSPAMLSDETVEKVRDTERRVAEQSFLKRKSHGFRLGQRVRVDADPFVGLGIVERLGDSERITVLMGLLGRQARILVPAHQVQPA